MAANVCAHEAMVVESLWLLGAEHVCVVPGYFLMLREVSVSAMFVVFLLFQHIVSALGIIEDILFAVDSLVLLGFDVATTCLFC